MSQTATVELLDYSYDQPSSSKVQSPPSIYQRPGHALKGADTYLQSEQELPSLVPSDAVEQLPRWNQDRATTSKVACCFLSLFCMGLNDGTTGIEEYYNLSYTVVSLVFLTPFVGYTAAALANNIIHVKLGQRGIAIIGPICRAIAYAVLVARPPFPVVAVVLTISGFGIGIEDAAWNAYCGAMANTNQLLGCLHALYGAGATVSPISATSLITKAGWDWNYWYAILVGFALFQLALDIYAFRDCSAAHYRASIAATSGPTGVDAEEKSMVKTVLFHPPAARITWITSLFLFGYMGVEVSIGGWIVTFMRQARGGKPFQSGVAGTGFWLGLTMGRMILGFVTPLIGEKIAISVYLVIAMGVQLVFWLVPSFVVSAVFVALEGFFIGPLFPAAIIATTKLLPKKYHVSVIGFAAAFGGSGGAAFPFIVGAIANATSVKSLQPIILAILACILALWLCLPRMSKRQE